MATYYYWTGSGVTARANSTAYSLGARVVIATGDTSTNYLVVRRYVLECTTAGTSGAAVPVWSASYTPDTSTITDGTVTWTVRNPGYSSGNTVNWTFATIYLDYALKAANSSNDVVLVQYTSREELTATYTYSLENHVSIISVDKDNLNTPTPMGTANWIGSSSAIAGVGFTGSFRGYFYGLTLRAAGGSFRSISFGSNGADYLIDSCYLWQGNSGTAPTFLFGVTGTGTRNFNCRVINTTFYFQNRSDQKIQLNNVGIEFNSCTITGTGTKPSVLLDTGENATYVNFIGCDLSYITGTLVTDLVGNPALVRMSQCKLGAGVTVLATQSNISRATQVHLFDCSSGDNHGLIGYYDMFGSCVSDTGIYYTSGAAQQSWKIVTTANCSYYNPFISPFIDYYNTGTAAVTPYLEILRDGSTAAYQNDEVWAEYFVKITSGSVATTPYSDRMPLLSTPANQSAGIGIAAWTGKQATAWSGKIDSGSAVTPAESGHIRGRVVVGEPSITVYVDPQIRT